MRQGKDLASELGASSIDSRFHRAFGHVQPIGDFLIGELLDVTHQHGVAQGRRQHGFPFRFGCARPIDRNGHSPSLGRIHSDGEQAKTLDLN